MTPKTITFLAASAAVALVALPAQAGEKQAPKAPATATAAPETDRAHDPALPAEAYGSETSALTPAPSPLPPGATVTTKLITNGPVPDTRENRARFGGPMSNAGRRTAPAGN